jgi:hypothetical protein
LARPPVDEDKPLPLSPPVFVPARHDYVKASQRPGLARGADPDLLACHDQVCRGESLLRLSRLAADDPRLAREPAYRHNRASRLPGRLGPQDRVRHRLAGRYLQQTSKQFGIGHRGHAPAWHPPARRRAGNERTGRSTPRSG